MRRQRSVSFYAENEEEYIEEYNKIKSISERRRCRSRSYAHNNEENSDSQANNDYSFRRKKFFQSYDDLELDQLGVNSTFQITTLKKEDSEDNEGGLIQKINNINISFKQKNNNSFFSNLAPFTKNIIGPLESRTNPKQNIMLGKAKNNECLEDENISKYNLINDKKIKKEKNNEINDNDDDNDDYGNLLGTGYGSYQMGYLEQSNQGEDPKEEKRERINSIIENNVDNDENDDGLGFLDNININELHNSNSKEFQNSDNYSNENEDFNNDYNTNYKFEQESPKKIKNINDDNISYSCNINNIEDNKDFSENDNCNKNNDSNDKNDDKKLRRYTFDINSFIPDNNYRKEGEENENENSKSQNKTLQNFISKNEFLSKNIDFVDEHLKFLITGSDIKSKHLFLNQLLNEKWNYDETFNICKKVIKLLGDYIKLELYEEECNLCYSHMLNTYIDFQDGVILIINMNIPFSANYIYDIIEKLKYKINKDKRHFNAILFCFEIIEVEDLKSVEFDKEESIKKNNINNINNLNLNNNNNINESKEIIDKIIKDFELKPNYITFYTNKKGDCLKNKKFGLVINKFLSLAYLKKERKRKNKISPKNKSNVKKHKRGITGL